MPAAAVVASAVITAWRDEQRCSAKYGDPWHEYCRAVPGRILPSWRGLQMALCGEDVWMLRE